MSTSKFCMVNLIVVSFTFFVWSGLPFPRQTIGPSFDRVAAQSILVKDKPVGIEETALTPSFSLPIAHTFPLTAPGKPAGMAFDLTNNQLLMVSERADTLYVINPDDGTIIRMVQLPILNPVPGGSYGIAVADDFWWHTNYQELKLYKLAPATGEIIGELPMPSRYLGIAWDGTNLWGVEPGSSSKPSAPAKKLYRIDPKSGDILETIDLANIASPIDLTWDGANLWVTERNGSRFHQVDVSGNILRTETTLGPGGGITTQGPFIWVGDFNQQMLYRFTLYSTYLPLVLDFERKK